MWFHSWNAGDFLGSFLLASLYPKWFLPLYIFLLFSLVLYQGLLGTSLPGADLLLHPSGLFFGGNTFSFHHFSFSFSFLFNWKLNKMRKILAPVSNLYVFNLKFYIFTSIIVLFYIDIIQNCTMPYIQNIKSFWKQRNVQTRDWLTIFFWLATYIPDTYYFTWNKVLQ